MAAATKNTNNTTIRYEKKMKFVEHPIGPAPDHKTADHNTIDMGVNLEQEVACIMLSKQAKHELFKIVKAFYACKQEDGHSVISYLLKMKSYLETLELLGYAMPKELGVSLILNSLNKDYDQFIQNYNMHSMRKTLAELHAMLKLYEKSIPKKAETPAVLAIREGKIQKDKKKSQVLKGNNKGKNKLAYAPKAKIPLPPKRDNPVKDSICYHDKEGLKESRKLKHGALSLYMGNGMCVSVEAIESFDLILPSGLIILLGNCHFTPTVIGGVVLISHLVNNGYIHTFTNYGISVSKDNVFYFNALPRDGIYEIDMHNLYPNRDGLLQPTHDESHEKCKSCISRKIARKPFPHQVERAKDLLGLIHTDDEVENQLGKKIKAFRSDRGGEYMSHEFVNHMKSCGIVSQLTPPFTPQHNEVSKRRNRTLLNTVRSMMNLRTLQKSFWGCALETDDRILNMVPTKKVDRTPYEI
nr:zinc finger, CCHC-type [Tanacetum cinerariifolium]